MNLKKIGKVFTSKFVGTGRSSYKKNNLPGRGLTKVEKHWCSLPLDLTAVSDAGTGSGRNWKLGWSVVRFGHFRTACFGRGKQGKKMSGAC